MRHMIINKFGIKNFRSIISLGDWILHKDRIQVLLGKNGSGKTAILDALNCLGKNKLKITDSDKPLENPNKETELTIQFKISNQELKNKKLIELIDKSKDNSIIEIRKCFHNNQDYDFLVNDRDIFYYINKKIEKLKHIIDLKGSKKILGYSDKQEPIKLNIKYDKMDILQHDLNTLKKQIANNKKQIKNIKIAKKNYENLSNSLNTEINNIINYKNYLNNIIPDFVNFRFTDFSNFTNILSYNKEEFGKNKLYQLIFKSMNLNFDDFIKSSDRPQIIEQLANKRNMGLEAYLNRNWFNERASIEMKFYPNRFSCLTLENNIFPYISQRSAGEIWLFTFLVYIYSQVKLNKPTIILIDEPSINLHPNAQRNILKILEKFLGQNHNISIIYTTHSPYLVPNEHLDRICYIIRRINQGTIIKQLDYKELLKVKQKRLRPGCTINSIISRLSKMFDVSMREGFFGNIIALCEGPTEFMCIPIWAKILNQNLDEKGIILIHTSGKDEMIDYAEFFKMFEIPVFLIFDNDNHPEKNNAHQKKHRELNRWFLEFAKAKVEDFPVNSGENYFVFNPSYELNLKREDPNYEALEQSVGRSFGTGGKKAIRARYVALEYLNSESKTPPSIKNLITSLFKFREKMENY